MTKTPHEIFDGSDHKLIVNKDDLKGSFDINIDLERSRQMTQHELEIRDAERTGVKAGYIAGAQKERAEILEMIEKLIEGESIIMKFAAELDKRGLERRRKVLKSIYNAIKQRNEGRGSE